MSESLTSLSRPQPTVWQITLQSPPDNRLSPALLAELSKHLDTVESEWRSQGGGQRDLDKRGKFGGAGALVITSAFPKFFSNGLDPKSLGDPSFFESVYDPVIYRLMTFPLVTIAAVNGHAFAGGMVLALACDYRVMNAKKGMMSMNELLIGLPLPNSFSAFLRQRLSFPVLRDTAFARRWTQPEMLKAGIIDEVADEDKVVSRAIEMGLEKGKFVGSGTWGLIKDGMYHDVQDASRGRRQVIMPDMDAKMFATRIQRQNGKL